MDPISGKVIRRLLVANRGEIATRIISTARELEIETFSVFTENDSSHTMGSTHSIKLSSPASYLNISELVEIAKKYNIDTIHPGYGFLSESAEFSRRMSSEANVLVIGPGPEILARTGDKLQARLLAEECHVPILPALQTPTSNVGELQAFATMTGYPIIIKAVDGGGGRGIRIVRKEEDLHSLAKRALQESPSGMVFAEKAAIDDYRHIEVQIIGDGKGTIRHLWERECSIQRRFQKVVEFTPSSITDRKLVTEVINAARRMARRINYASLGTFEFLVREATSSFYFLEVNPRIQVEHTVTESMAMGIDLVRIQLLLAQGHSLASLLSPNLSENPEVPPSLQSLQLRITAEDASRDWSLSIGRITSFQFPSGNGIRVDTHLIHSQPTIIGTDFDSLVAKIIITAPSWVEVVGRAKRALMDTHIEGVQTNLDILRGIIASEAFATQKCSTEWLETSLPTLLESGKRISQTIPRITNNSEVSNPLLGGSSNVLFRKGDAWSISLTPESSSSMGDNAVTKTTAPILSHLQITSVRRNDFPHSLQASILYTPSPHTPTSTNSYTQVSTPYLLTLTSSSLSSHSSSSLQHHHQQGDTSNPAHVIIPFPGKIIEITVKVGDRIKEGEVVAVVQQMKMELEVRSRRAGRVGWVMCVGGEGEGEGGVGIDVREGCLVAIIEGEGGAKL